MKNYQHLQPLIISVEERLFNSQFSAFLETISGYRHLHIFSAVCTLSSKFKSRFMGGPTITRPLLKWKYLIAVIQKEYLTFLAPFLALKGDRMKIRNDPKLAIDKNQQSLSKHHNTWSISPPHEDIMLTKFYQVWIFY